MNNFAKKVESVLRQQPIIDANINVVLELDGSEYSVEQFSIGFSQSVDHKGEPQEEVTGGQFTISMLQILPESFYSWSIDNNRSKSGTIAFRLDTRGTILEINFTQARCISFMRNLSSNGGVVSTLIISPKEIKINGIKHDNRWKNE